MMTNYTKKSYFYKLLYNSQLLNNIWVIIRSISSLIEQNIPSLAGFVSSVGNKPSNLTIINHYPMINHPIIDFKTV